MEKVSTDFIGQENRQKLYAIIIGLIMILSGIIVSTMVVGAGEPRGARGIDVDLTNNTFLPEIVINAEPAATPYPNNRSVMININCTVKDSDDTNNSDPNGSAIVSVELDLTSFGIANAMKTMTYEGNLSLIPGVEYNATRFEGWYNYTINFSEIIDEIGSIAAGDYNISITATDDHATNPFTNTTANMTVKVFQVNRPPAERTTGEGRVSSYTLAEDDLGKIFDINNTVFIDPDVANVFPNTAADSVSFKFYDGTTWRNTGIADMGNFTVQFNGSSDREILVTPVANKFTLAAGEDIMFNATDDSGEWKTAAVTIIITAVNDVPVIESALTWDFNNLNASADDDTTISLKQGDFINFTVNATDIDGDTLTFSVPEFEANDTDLATSPIEFADENMGNVTFTLDNDGVGTFWVNITVEDDTDMAFQNFTFMVANINDPPTMTKVNSLAPANHKISLSATQDVKFDVALEASDPDVERELGDSLSFKAGTMDLTTNDDNVSANYNFTPTNSDVGIMEINFTVTDGDVTDYVVANISIANVNDAPEVTKVMKGLMTYTEKKIDLTGGTPTDENISFTIYAEDIDMAVVDEELSLGATGVAAMYYEINKTTDTTWDVLFIADEDINGVNVLNFTVSDKGTLTDYVEITIEVNVTTGPGPQPNRKPTINITTPAGEKYKIGDKITINGQWEDLDGDDIIMKVKITFPEGDYGLGLFLTIGTKADYDANTTEYNYIDIKSDGTWTYVFDTGRYKSDYDAVAKVSKELAALMLKLTKGTCTFEFKAQEDIFLWGEESDPKSVTVVLEEEKKEDGDGEDNMMMILLLVIIIIIIIIIIAAVAMKKKKKKAAEEVPPPEEGMAPPPEEGMPEGVAPPMEMACTTCGQLIPAGAPTCPACGAPAPVPPEAPLEEAPPVACATCGATIPPGSPTCPACGAPAPPPAAPPEVPPEAPPEGMPPEAPPPEAPPEGMPPEAPPPEGMPPEAPPPEGMPPAAPPPEGMPPEAPPPEAPAPPPAAPPPAEGAAAAPPPGMATCPQCGTQIAVGTTPCPGCGAALNW